ncbi:MAG: hypothetical protein JW727_06690 [Candidatus Aenigmarchaeota archaeon]|nr:hypothetical protein [Candidatus Aenigmarchaeota archaeon]
MDSKYTPEDFRAHLSSEKCIIPELNLWPEMNPKYVGGECPDVGRFGFSMLDDGTGYLVTTEWGPANKKFRQLPAAIARYYGLEIFQAGTYPGGLVYEMVPRKNLDKIKPR